MTKEELLSKYYILFPFSITLAAIIWKTAH